MSNSIKNYFRPNNIRPKRVLLVAPNTRESIFSSRWVTAHQGIHWWASRLNKWGHYTATYDMNMAPVEFDTVLKRGMPIRRGVPVADLWDSANCVEFQSWDIIGFSVLDATIEYDMARIIRARELCPDALLIAGGSQATLNYQALFDKTPLDMVVLGQDPYALLRISNEEKIDLFRPHSVSGIVLRSHARPPDQAEWIEWVDELDFRPMRQDLYWDKTASMFKNPDLDEIHTFRLFMHNYCPMNCSFCTLTDQQRIATGRKVLPIGLAGCDIMRTIRRVLGAYPQTRRIFFCDDDMFLRRDWTEELLDEIIAAKNRKEIPEYLGFICLTNINRINTGMVTKCTRAGFKVLSIGVESVSQWKLNSMNKAQSVQQIWEATRLILESGIKPYYTLLMFTPFDRIEDLVTDLNGFRRMAAMGVGLSIEPYLMPLHGTIFWEANVPQRNKVIPIDGTRRTIKKGSAWMPVREDVLAVFFEFEKIMPRYKRWRHDRDLAAGISHQEKNWYSHVILDSVELVLRSKFQELMTIDEHRIEAPKFSDDEVHGIMCELEEMGDFDIDSSGTVVPRAAAIDPCGFDFSTQKKDVLDFYRRVGS